LRILLIFLVNFIKTGIFDNFSGKNHAKFGHFGNFSDIFRAKMSCPLKLTELLRLCDQSLSLIMAAHAAMLRVDNFDLLLWSISFFLSYFQHLSQLPKPFGRSSPNFDIMFNGVYNL